MVCLCFFFFQAEDGIRDAQESRGLGDVYKRQPVGWADVATKRDLDQLTEHFEMKFGRIDDRFDRIDARFERTDERFGLLLNARTAEQRADTAQLRADFEGSLRRMQTVLLSAFLTLAGVLIALSVFGPS